VQNRDRTIHRVSVATDLQFDVFRVRVRIVIGHGESLRDVFRVGRNPKKTSHPVLLRRKTGWPGKC
jgi:hypothetical protein